MDSPRVRITVRPRLGYVLALAGTVALTVVLSQLRAHLSVDTSLIAYLLLVVTTAALGGRGPGIVAALGGSLAAIWFLIPPYHTFRVHQVENISKTAAFIIIALVVSSLVSTATQRALDAEHARRDAIALSKLAESSRLDPIEEIVNLVRETFNLQSASLVFSDGTTETSVNSGWPSIDASTEEIPVGANISLRVNGPILTDDDRRLLRSFLSQLERSIDQRRVRAKAMEAETLMKADELKTAILRAVSHDLRTPLAGIKAAVSSLRQNDVEWSPEAESEFLLSIESETDRLTRLITNLLDLSRIEVGAIAALPQTLSIDSLIASAVDEFMAHASVKVDLASSIPDVYVDAALTERALANIVSNAVKWSPKNSPVEITASQEFDFVVISVTDHGPGIAPEDRERVLRPFHRLDDSRTGLGLGLAIADRLTSAVGGHLSLGTTDGGGLTVRLSLPTQAKIRI